MHSRPLRHALVLCLVFAPAGCRTRPAEPIQDLAPAPPPVSAPWNDEIVVAGQKVHTGAPVVLWSEPPHYDASRAAPRFRAPSADPAQPEVSRFQPGRVRKIENPVFRADPDPGEDLRSELEKTATLEEVLLAPESHDLATLREVVDQFVIHFDVCGLSRTCFKVLQDERHLSVHFLLDIDGTIYQTLDARDTAWHATKSNGRSVGIEIANMGAYAPGRPSALDAWYQRDARGTYIKIPDRIRESGVRTPGFVGRPARDERVQGRVQGQLLEQFDFTPEQYDSLVKLAAALCVSLPRIRVDAPRDAQGRVLDRALDDAAWRDFHGILGHYHVQTNKNDPGPAFDWEPFLERVRARVDELARASR